jgi:Ca2+-dependent lipid-binding protein
MAAQAKEDKKLVISDDDDRSIMSVTDGTVTKKKKTGKKTGKKKKKKKLGPISKDDEETKLLKIAIKSGRGFQIERKRMKKDIPDVYCIAIFGTKKWRTSTIQDDVKPKWNESELFAVRTGDPHIIELEAWDANGSGRSDDLYGTIDIPIQELLLKPDNTMEVELLDKSKKGLGIFITLSGQLVSKTTVDDVRRVQVTVVKGNGFKVLKKKFGLMKDIPDIYCKVKVEGNYGDWQTKTIQDSQAPVWYESKTYNISTENQKIKLEAWDENDKRPDEYYGALEVKVKKLLSNAGPMALELKGSDGKGLGLFITLGCKFVKDN